MTFSIVITPTAQKMFLSLTDKRIRAALSKRINLLANEPEKLGQELHGELAGLRSLRAVGQRYRVIYRIEEDQVVVLILAVGIRKEGDKKDIYNLTKKLLRLRLLEP